MAADPDLSKACDFINLRGIRDPISKATSRQTARSPHFGAARSPANGCIYAITFAADTKVCLLKRVSAARAIAQYRYLQANATDSARLEFIGPALDPDGVVVTRDLH